MPMTTGAGSALPVDTSVMTGPTISVMVKLSMPVRAAGAKFRHGAATLTESPTTTIGCELVKTKMASEVPVGIGFGSWR